MYEGYEFSKNIILDFFFFLDVENINVYYSKYYVLLIICIIYK